MPPSSLKPFRRVATRVVGDYRVFRLLEHRTVAPRDGLERTSYTIESCDWVNVIPLTAAGEVIMVRQYRHGLDGFTLEIPGGMCDPGEDPAVAAARELREETGYAGTIVPLGWVLPNPAIQTNRCHVYLASDARKVGEPEPDATEDLEVEVHARSEIPARIADGTIRHALVVAAFASLERYEACLTVAETLDRLEEALGALGQATSAEPQFEAGRRAGLDEALRALASERARLTRERGPGPHPAGCGETAR